MCKSFAELLVLRSSTRQNTIRVVRHCYHLLLLEKAFSLRYNANVQLTLLICDDTQANSVTAKIIYLNETYFFAKNINQYAMIVQNNMTNILKCLKTFNWQLFVALCALLLIPAIYQTAETFIISANDNGAGKWQTKIIYTLSTLGIIS